MIPIVERVGNEPATAGGLSHYLVSRSGALAYVPAAGAFSLVVVHPDGTERPLAEEQRRFRNPRFSPAGRLVVVAGNRREGEPVDLWLYDLGTGTATRLTPDGAQGRL